MDGSNFALDEFVEEIRNLKKRIERLETFRQPILGNNIRITDQGIELLGPAGITIGEDGTIVIGTGLYIDEDGIKLNDGSNDRILLGFQSGGF